MYASNRPTLGRRMLMTDEREITRDNIISVVSKAFMEHQENVAQEVFLFEYEKGNQPILNREKKIRPDLNATVVENNASKIVDVHLGYCFSNPITFVQRAKIEPTKKQKKALFGFLRKKDEDDGENIDDLKIAMLNKMMQEQSKAAKDIALGRNLFICGVGYQMMLPNRNKSRYSPFELLVPSPLTTFGSQILFKQIRLRSAEVSKFRKGIYGRDWISLRLLLPCGECKRYFHFTIPYPILKTGNMINSIG